MTSKHLMDLELAPIIEQFPALSFDELGIDAVRAFLATIAPPPPSLPDTVETYEARVPGPPGAPDVRVIITRPKTRPEPTPAILHVHGGGFVLGSAEMTLESDVKYAQALGVTCVSVDYRLAPETPYPGPVEDCYAALAWLYEQAPELGVDTDRIIVSGESAGGGLAAALVLLARDRGQLPVAFQHLVFPMLDDRTVVHPDPSPYVGQYVWWPDHNRFGWRALLGCEPGAPNVSPYAAPARAADLSGLPPTFISVGALDLFLEEDLEYARRLIRAGVPAEVHVYAGAPHGFPLAREAEVTRAFERDALAALARAMRRS